MKTFMPACMTAMLLCAGCTMITSLFDSTPPAEVTRLTAVAADGRVILSWTEPGDDDFSGVRILCGSMPDTEVVLAKGSTSRTFSGLADETEYTFTVKTCDPSGNVSDGVSVKATPTAQITFITEGTSFSPRIKVVGEATVLWTWADGTTSGSASPDKDFGTEATRAQTLKVTPWSALRRINLGYDGGDGGTLGNAMHPGQRVSAVEGLEAVAPYLREWCSSTTGNGEYPNFIERLDFNSFVNLETIECFLLGSLKTVNLSNTPSLERACFEDCSLENLDLSESPSLYDLRGAVNEYAGIEFGNTGADTWHICIRDNPQFTDRHMWDDMSRFPNIGELFIWNDNQTGALEVHSTGRHGGINIAADGNRYTSADFTGAFAWSGAWSGNISLQDNGLESIDVAGCTNLTTLSLSTTDGEWGYLRQVHYLDLTDTDESEVSAFIAGINKLSSLDLTGCARIGNIQARNNRFTPATIDAILTVVNGFNTSGGTIDLRSDQTAVEAGVVTAPVEADLGFEGKAALDGLRGRGWTVLLGPYISWRPS